MSYATWSLVYGEQPSTAKWNILGTNDAHFYSFLGANLAWTSYTPTFTNLTVGNGTLVAAYTQIGKTVYVRVGFQFGTTSSMGTLATFTLPVTATARITNSHIGQIMLEDASAGSWIGYLIGASTTTVSINVISATSTYASRVSPTSTIPFTWTTSDYIGTTFSYEAA